MELEKHKQYVCVYQGEGNAEKQFYDHVYNDSMGKISVSSKDMSFNETDIRENACDHTWHDGNKKDQGILYQALEPLNWDTEFHGGLIYTPTFQQPPYRDNFGNWRGTLEDVSHPLWLGEVGSVFFVPWYEKWGIGRVWHGTRKIRVWNFIGAYNDGIQRNSK
jgi:hypothetical protein